MAIKIPIITVFDSKGLKQAQYQLNRVSGNFQNLGRNAVIAGAAVGAVGIGLTKSVKVASDLGESVNAINVSFGKSAKGILEFGETASTTLGLSKVEFNNAAVRFSGFADKIVGAGNDSSKFIEQITTRAADFASVYNIDVADALERFQSGLAGQTEPLAKFGVNLLDSEVKAYAVRAGIAKLGEELTATEKTQARFGLLMESTNKTAGDFANTSDSLANGMRILQAQFTDVQGEIGEALLPVLQELLPVVQDLVQEFGDKLKIALTKVDFKSLATNVMNLAIFFVENIEAITNLVITLYTLNTAFNVIKVTSGLINAGMFILGNTFTVTAGKIGLATGAVKLFRTALITTGIGALVVGLGFIIEAIINTNNAAEKGKPYVDSYGGAIRTSGADAEWAAGRYGIATKAATDFNNVVSSIDLTKIPRSAATTRPLRGGQAEDIFAAQDIIQEQEKQKGEVSAPRTTFAQLLSTNKLEQTRTNKLIGTGLSAGAAELALSTIENKKQFTKLITRLSNPAIRDKRQTTFNQTAAGIAELAQIRADGEARNAQIKADQDAADRLRDERIAAEKAAADERARIYKSFADSVTNTFASIKDAIVGAFSLPELGGSTDSIIRNMDKLLTRVKSFSANITKLSSMGLDPALLQQVIQAGPVAGARLAAGLVAGGADALGRINAGFGEIQTLGSEIGMTGTQSRFNNTTQQNIYTINVEGGVGSGATIGKAIVDAIKAYERTSGPVWQGA